MIIYSSNNLSIVVLFHFFHSVFFFLLTFHWNRCAIIGCASFCGHILYVLNGTDEQKKKERKSELWTEKKTNTILLWKGRHTSWIMHTLEKNRQKLSLVFSIGKKRECDLFRFYILFFIITAHKMYRDRIILMYNLLLWPHC